MRWSRTVTDLPGSKVQWAGGAGLRRFYLYCFSGIAALIGLGCLPITAFKINKESA